MFASSSSLVWFWLLQLVVPHTGNHIERLTQRAPRDTYELFVKYKGNKGPKKKGQEVQL